MALHGNVLPVHKAKKMPKVQQYQTLAWNAAENGDGAKNLFAPSLHRGSGQ